MAEKQNEADSALASTSNASQCGSTCVEQAIVGFLPMCFSSYAGLLQNRVVLPILIFFGVALLGILAAGASQGTLETELNEIWIPKDSRIEGERDFYTEHFGGTSNLEFVILSDRNKTRNTVNTGTKLSSLAYIASGFQDQNDQCGDEIVVNPREPTFYSETTSGGNQSFHLSNFCEQVPAPQSLAPCLTCTTENSLDYLATSGNLPIAWGYAALARCTWNNRASTKMPASIQAAYGVSETWSQTGMSDWSLNSTWGIPRLPCKGANLLKAFKEGNIGYPACLRLLEKDRSNFFVGGFTNAVAGGLVWGTADANYYFENETGCIDGTPNVGSSVKDIWYQHVYAANVALGADIATATAAATTASTSWARLLRIYVTTLYAWGYRHKTSYAALVAGSTDDGAAAIADFISTAIDNHQLTVPQCLGTTYSYGGVVRGRCPCILDELTLSLPEELMISTDRDGTSGAYTRFGSFRATATISALNAVNHVERLKAKGVETEDERRDLLEKWEEKLYDYLNPFWERTDALFAAGGTYEDSNVDFFMTKKSLVDQLRATGEFSNSVLLIIIGMTLLIVFAMSWYCSCHPKLKYSSVVVSVGIVCVAGGVAGGYGSLGWMSYNYSVSSPVVALVGLGLGCNDLFVILNSYFSTVGTGKSTEEVIQLSLKMAGPSVVVTTMSNIVGFSIAAVMDIPAVRTFCIQMAITCFLTLVGMMMVVMPMMVVHCGCVNNVADSTNGEDTAAGGQPTDPEAGAPERKASANPGANPEDGSEHNLLGLTQVFVTKYYAPKLEHIMVKTLILVLWLIMTGLAIWGIVELKLGLSIADVSEEGSYQYDFSKMSDGYSGYIGTVVSRQSTWNSEAIQKAALDQDVVLQTSKWISTTNKLWNTNWLGNSTRTMVGFAATQGLTTNGNTPNVATGENMYTKGANGLSLFDQWLAVSGTVYTDFLVCHTSQTSGVRCSCTNTSEPDRRVIVASHAFTLKGLADVPNFVDMIENTRDLTDNSNANGNDAYVYGIAYQYWEQYVGIESRLALLCGLCILGIVFVCMLVEFSFLIAAMMVIVLATYAFTMVGVIPMIGLKLNAFSLVNVVVSISLAVEYLVHLTHCFMVATGTREERVYTALDDIAAATLAGGFTTFLAILPLVFSSIPLFKDYYFASFAVACGIGLFNGLALWPVLLSIMGPASTSAAPDVKPAEATTTNVLIQDVAMKQVEVGMKQDDEIDEQIQL
jgi:predicted RND superfamily exporter protein